MRCLSLSPGKKAGDIRERGVTQKSRLHLKRPIVFSLWSRDVESQVQRRRGLCVSEARAGSRAILGVTPSSGCRELVF